MYVVGAHNSVNLRVGIKNGHDPKYTKQIFPALFLCNNCWKADLTENKPALTRFIVDYYSAIKPYGSPKEPHTETSDPVKELSGPVKKQLHAAAERVRQKARNKHGTETS